MMPNDGPMQVIIAKLINRIGLIAPRKKKEEINRGIDDEKKNKLFFA
jgi:hypothetical protein